MSAPKGSWSADDLRRAFVAGAAWRLYRATRSTPFSAERDEMEAEAEWRYPGGRPRGDATTPRAAAPVEWVEACAYINLDRVNAIARGAARTTLEHTGQTFLDYDDAGELIGVELVFVKRRLDNDNAAGSEPRGRKEG